MKAIAACLLAFALVPTVASAQAMKDMPGILNTAMKTGKGVGVVTALDSKAAKVTIKHGPIPAVGWPAMTMTFKSTPPALLRNVHVGQAVAFDMRTKGMDAEVTAIQPR
ncbi:copper-binding protein [Sphingomonas oligoaromativorans]|uniref:copper-binding protein n=1 Tax=Sphingomonas oligoaromativorans TaxID=575322 RepID=UPI001ABA373A|nr:copper-binding protein [Sphingomonas oligoaromativorans]NIJ35145.1 Cu(I)/Ag(I) efflux system protein CusF [Sphingomonas oligoaromativorans]